MSLSLILGLAGCESAVSGWRSVTGVNRNDPDPQTAPFTANMAAADVGAYPNLASVPPPPNVTTSSAERQKLTDTLITERAAAAAAGSIPTEAPGAAPLGARPAPASLSAAGPAAATPVATSPAAAAVPGRQAANEPISGTSSGGSAGAAHRRQDEPPEPQPRDSSLTMPTIPGPLPQPEATQPPPPAPILPAVPAPVVAPPLPPAAVAAATPVLPPPVPVLPPIVPPPLPPKAATAKPAPALMTVATLDVATSGTPGADERAEIDRVASLYKEKPSIVRVVALAAAPVNGTDPLASYHAALERAQAIAKELTAAGIPSNKVQTEASPATGSGNGRIEIQFLP